MHQSEAKYNLQKALKHNKTIRITKLKQLMSVLNMTLKSSRDVEVDYLKGEIRKLRAESTHEAS